jgi:hypothetical protein
MPRLDLDVWCLNRSCDDQRRALVTHETRVMMPEMADVTFYSGGIVAEYHRDVASAWQKRSRARLDVSSAQSVQPTRFRVRLSFDPASKRGCAVSPLVS